MECNVIAKDPINPPHYKNGPFKMRNLECIEVTRHLPFAAGNAVKYVWRAGNKGPVMEDLKKSMWYLTEWISAASDPWLVFRETLRTMFGQKIDAPSPFDIAKAIFELTESAYEDRFTTVKREIIMCILDRNPEAAKEKIETWSKETKSLEYDGN